VLWDLNWQFIYRYGYNPDFYATTGGNNQFLRLVLDGCKLQVCNPGMLDGRNAILRADSINNGAANSALIWTMFARRGMGFSADQGPRTAAGNPTLPGIVEAFNLPPGVTAASVLNPNLVPLGARQALVTRDGLEAYPNPAQNQVTVRTVHTSTKPMQVQLLDMVGKTLQTTTVAASQMQRTGVELNTTGLAAGVYVVRVTTSEGTFSTKVTIER
jgi:hypothetical protein